MTIALRITNAGLGLNAKAYSAHQLLKMKVPSAPRTTSAGQMQFASTCSAQTHRLSHLQATKEEQHLPRRFS